MVPCRVPARPAQTSNSISLGNDNPPAPTRLRVNKPARTDDILIRPRQMPSQLSNSTTSGSGASVKKAVVPSTDSRTSQGVTPANAASAGARGDMEDDMHHELGSATPETRNEPFQRPAVDKAPTRRRRRRIQELKHGQGGASASTAGGAMDSKKQTKFKNFIPNDAPAKDDPSVRPTTEQDRAASPDIVPCSGSLSSRRC